MLQEVFQLIDNLIVPLIVILCILGCYKVAKRYIRLLGMFNDCKRLAKKFNGEVVRKRMIFPLVFISRAGADIVMKFGKETVAVKFIRVKPKTTVRFRDDNTVEFIRYRRAIGLQGDNKGLTPSYRVMGANGIDMDPIIKRRKIVFFESDGVKKYLFFTNELSNILVYNEDVKNYRVIGEGEASFSYIVGGYRYIKKWLSRNGI